MANKKENIDYLEEIKQAYEFMVKNKLDIVEYSNGEEKIKLVRKTAKDENIQILPTVAAGSSVTANAQGKATATLEQQVIEGITIKAPMSGIFYRSPSPSSPPYVREGDVIEANSIVCLIEAMKVFNEIKSDSKCKIIKCLAENGKFVNEGDNLFVIEKA